MKKIFTAFLIAVCFNTTTMAQKTRTVRLRIIQTSDVHGAFFPYDFINRRPMKGSMARVATYVDSLRAEYGKNLLLLDNGDILQGQPTCYYCNYVKPEMENVAAKVVNYMQYDVETIGNHDVETGHAVYDKWIKEVKCPMLGANVIDVQTGLPYLHPYTILERDGVKIAVVGMLTPAIPNWLHEYLWKGLRFDDMVASARYWVDYIQKNERPHVIIGLFHSGRDGGIQTDEYMENTSIQIAKEVPGFDLVLYGHDHTQRQEIITADNGSIVVCLDPSCDARLVGDVQIEVTMRGNKAIEKQMCGEVVDISNLPVNSDFMDYFQIDVDSVKAFVNRKIGTFKQTIYTRDSYFGSSAFCDFIHNLQLKVTGADISFNAPLTFNASIQAGDVHVSDLFNLYKYENQIYVMSLTGEEIRKHLEMSYSLWVNTMTSPDDHIMLLNGDAKSDKQRNGFKNLVFNFDSAAGIDYVVDVTKPHGEKVKIFGMSNGEPFYPEKRYRVAMNSYRGNGGGELLTKGAGIPQKELQTRILYMSEKDQRYYLMKEIEEGGILDPKPNNNWHFVPTEWAEPALKRDRQIIFGK
ncbi:MAG: 5'-nucleotidase C-terminal domain-containing protein [Prevotellaceae bacterium]|nr:5'-nucleotidase C-terminal domain-containing protein [Prevotella sp.]MDD7257232.1 5'-nucleotidase C-terminal domain-containing protein [Prevotellaceae bacterium]MDY6130692.1 5'-nucleotidase C-terminal domain-containing protein [Prevotella sp.]